MEISLEKNFFAGYVTRDKGLTEGEMRECLQGQTEEGLYVHQQRGEKNQEQKDFGKWCFNDNALKNHSRKLSISQISMKRLKLKRKLELFPKVYTTLT